LIVSKRPEHPAQALDRFLAALPEDLSSAMAAADFRKKALKLAGTILRAAITDPERDALDDVEPRTVPNYTDLMISLTAAIESLEGETKSPTDVPPPVPLGPTPTGPDSKRPGSELAELRGPEPEGFRYQLRFQQRDASWAVGDLEHFLGALRAKGSTDLWLGRFRELPRENGWTGRWFVEEDKTKHQQKLLVGTDARQLHIIFSGRLFCEVVNGKQLIYPENVVAVTLQAWEFVLKESLSQRGSRPLIQWRAGIYRSGGKEDELYLPIKIAPGASMARTYQLERAGSSRGFELEWQEQKHDDPAYLAHETLRQVYAEFGLMPQDIPGCENGRVAADILRR
jgi:hypothetical protein